MRLIDADALIEEMTHFSNATGEDMTHGIFYAHIAPTIDAVPVKRGEWVEYPYCLCYEGALTEEDIACSSCGAVFNVIDNCTEKFKYCPNCGAYMGTGND